MTSLTTWWINLGWAKACLVALIPLVIYGVYTIYRDFKNDDF